MTKNDACKKIAKHAAFWLFTRFRNKTGYSTHDERKKNMRFRQLTAAVLVAVTLLSQSAFPVWAAEVGATRGEVAQMLLQAADDYNPNVQKTDIIKGYEDGQLHEERGVTRAEALVMLKRAFGTLPKPVGQCAHGACKR